MKQLIEDCAASVLLPYASNMPYTDNLIVDIYGKQYRVKVEVDDIDNLEDWSIYFWNMSEEAIAKLPPEERKFIRITNLDSKAVMLFIRRNVHSTSYADIETRSDIASLWPVNPLYSDDFRIEHIDDEQFDQLMDGFI